MRDLFRRRITVLAIGSVLLCLAGLTQAGPVYAAGTADLSLTLNGPASVNEGEDVVYGARVVNDGPDSASGIVLTDQVPAGLSFEASKSTSVCGLTGSTVTCHLESLPPGYQLFVQIAFQTSTTGSFTNSATVTADETDPTPSDNTASVQTTVGPPVSADMSVTWSGTSDVSQGQRFSELLYVANNGPDTSTGSAVTVTVPQGIVPGFSGCSPSAAGETCTLTAGNEPPGVADAYDLQFTAAAVGQFALSATVTGDLQDPNSANNTATAYVTVTPSSDLSVALDWGGQAQQPFAGQAFQLDLSVSNGGPSPSTGSTVTLAVPAGMVPGFSGCSASGSGSTCTLQFPNLPVGAGVVARLGFSSTAAGQYTIGAQVSGNEPDPNASNNSTSLTVTIQASADIALASSASPNPVVAGHQVTETIVLTNNGPSPALGVTWSVSWSSDAKGGIDFESASVSTGTCALSGATLACNPGDLQSGQQVVLTLVLQPRSKGTLTIVSSASSTIHDPDTANNGTQTVITIG